MDDNLFVSTEIHERKITLNKKEVTLYFKEVPAIEFRRYFLIEQSDDIEKKVESMAYLISISLCNPDGSKAMNLEKAKTLKTTAMIKLFNAVFEVNQQGLDAEGKLEEG